MKGAGLLLFITLLALLATAPPAGAQPSEGRSIFHLSSGWVEAWSGPAFFARDVDAPNPTLTVRPGQNVTIILRNGDGAPHTLRVGSGERSAIVMETNEEIRYDFTAPWTGGVEYVCDIHPSTMTGRFVVDERGAPDPAHESPPGEGEGEPGNDEPPPVEPTPSGGAPTPTTAAPPGDEGVRAPTVDQAPKETSAGSALLGVAALAVVARVRRNG